MSEKLVLTTRVGRACGDDNHFHGHAVAGELCGRESVTGLIALAVLGRRLDEDEKAVLDDLAVVMTVADPRIWPLKLVRVVSSYGRALPALAAAQLCIEDALIGHWTTGAAAAQLAQLREALGTRAADDDAVAMEVERVFASGRRLMGFGVPFREQDERVVALRRCLAARGRIDRPHFRLFERVAQAVYTQKKLSPNIGVAVGAACLDLGATPRQASLLSVALGQTDYLANAVEGAAQAAPILRELPQAHVRYVGKPPRQSPRATAARYTVANAASGI